MPTDRLNQGATTDDVLSFVRDAFRQAQLVEDIRAAFTWSLGAGAGQPPEFQKTTLVVMRTALAEAVETARARHQKLLRRVPSVLKWLDDNGDATASPTPSRAPAVHAAQPSSAPAAPEAPTAPRAARRNHPPPTSVEPPAPKRREYSAERREYSSRKSPAPKETSGASAIAAGDLDRLHETSLESNIGDFIQLQKSITLSELELSRFRILRGGK